MVATEEKELHGYETVYHQNDLTFNLKETLKWQSELLQIHVGTQTSLLSYIWENNPDSGS